MDNNSNTTDRNTMFNTSRFIDVTTPRQRSNGTTFFLDSQNPGVYYGSYQSGYVRRIIATHTSHANLETGDRTSWTTDTAYQINRRCDRNTGNGITSLIFDIPVININNLSKPSPNPPCGHEPYLRRSK